MSKQEDFEAFIESIAADMSFHFSLEKIKQIKADLQEELEEEFKGEIALRDPQRREILEKLILIRNDGCYQIQDFLRATINLLENYQMLDAINHSHCINDVLNLAIKDIYDAIEKINAVDIEVKNDEKQTVQFGKMNQIVKVISETDLQEEE